MTDTSREAVERPLDGVTPGPWMVGEDQCVDDTWSIVTTSGGAVLANVNDRPARTANARFIAAARDLVPALLARAEAAEAERDALKAGQIDAIRAALEAAYDAIAEYPRAAPDEADWMRYDEQIEHSQHIIRAIDPAAIAAKLKGDGDERA